MPFSTTAGAVRTIGTVVVPGSGVGEKSPVLAPIMPGAPPLPVRIAFPTRWVGLTSMYLTHINREPIEGIAHKWDGLPAKCFIAASDYRHPREEPALAKARASARVQKLPGSSMFVGLGARLREHDEQSTGLDSFRNEPLIPLQQRRNRPAGHSA